MVRGISKERESINSSVQSRKRIEFDGDDQEVEGSQLGSGVLSDVALGGIGYRASMRAVRSHLEEG